MWNYRVVRKRTLLEDPKSKKERTYFTYAIHEAYYDKNGKAGSITQEAINPVGENIEELRHSWVMMAEAFGQSLLDYDNIPEPGYDRKENPIGTILDERIKKFEAGDEELIPWEEVKKKLEEKPGPFDEEKYEKEIEDGRKKKEKIHDDFFIGVSPLEKLIKNLYLDYKEFLIRDYREIPSGTS
jgi:hypothetical protein